MFRIAKSISGVRNYSRQFNSLIDITPEIKDALAAKKPIVALESTIITHGMPYPANIDTALEVERIVRDEKAIPATIAIIDGRIKVGLSDRDLEALANGTSGVPTLKTSRRDFAYVLSKKLNGGTTVSGTMIVANLVGIDVFATGGIGGVHREIEKTLDISADLTELGRSPIAVVSSGVKSILDIPRTLEFLETQGVTVTTYQSEDNEFPAFYTRKSGSKAPYNVNDPFEAANLIATTKTLNLNSGILIAVPVPAEFAMNDKEINKAISNAIEKSKSSGISGKEITPFLLSAIGKITQNKSLQTNIALIKNNARVAAQISVELSNIQKGNLGQSETSANSDQPTPVVVGGSIIDECCTVSDHPIKLDGSTYNSTTKMSGGGVGRNIAEGLSKLHGQVQLISKVGNDQNGDYLLNLLPKHCQTAVERDSVHPTCTCTVILDKTGDPKMYLANMSIHKTIDSKMIARYENVIKNAPIVVFDANIPVDGMGVILELCEKYQKPAFFEPTDMRIADKPFKLPSKLIRQIKFISPNIYELNHIARAIGCESFIECNESSIDNLLKNNANFKDSIKKITEELSRHIDNVLTTLGSSGILITSRNTTSDFKYFNSNYRYQKAVTSEAEHRFYAGTKLENIVNASGAGDSFKTGFITALIHGCREDVCVSVAMESAKAALNSPSAVPDKYFSRNHECWKTPVLYERI